MNLTNASSAPGGVAGERLSHLEESLPGIRLPPRNPFENRLERERSAAVDAGQLLPTDRRRDWGSRTGAQRIGGDARRAADVAQEIDEDLSRPATLGHGRDETVWEALRQA